MGTSTTCARLAPGWADAVVRAAPWQPDARSVLVVVPHPDDEALMFGGALARCAALGASLHVLAVTDGERAYPGSDAGSLARLRRVEQADALAELGYEGVPVTRLGIPDGSVADHEARLVDAIVEIAGAEHVDTVLAPWEHDHHADHEACGRAARRARRAVAPTAELVSGLFWSMLRDSATPGVAVSALSLSAGELGRKSAAIGAHRSQFDPAVATGAPVLGDDELALARWPREHVIVDAGR